MIGVLVALALQLLGNQLPARASDSPRELLVGSWVLVSREDRAANGHVVPEPNLGPDALGLLVYDRAGNVAAQLMRRSRSSGSGIPTRPTQLGMNNSGSADGYDAYFGTYTLDLESHSVTHHLVGALLPGDVGKSLTRHFQASATDLRLWFETEGASGQRVVRTLVWRRAATR
jgi:hypothetical protein